MRALSVNRIRGNRGDGLCDWECPEDTIGIKDAAEQKGSRYHNNGIPRQRNQQGRHSLLQSFECTTTGDGNCRDDKSDTYDRECLDTNLDRRLVVGEQSNHLSRYEQGEQHTDSHHTGGQTERGAEDLLDTLFLTSTIVEADDWTDTLDDSICRQVNKCL